MSELLLHFVCVHCDAINRVPRERLHQRAKCGSCHSPLFDGRPVPLDSSTRFDRHATYSDIPLLVDFWRAGAVPVRRWRRFSRRPRASSSQSYPPNSLDTHPFAKLLRVVLPSGR